MKYPVVYNADIGRHLKNELNKHTIGNWARLKIKSDMSHKIVISVGFIVLIIAYGLVNSRKSDTTDGIIIETISGPIIGSVGISRDGREYYAWHRIPFAQPPVGDLRFMDPLPSHEWTEIIDGRSFGPKCLQVNLFDFVNSVDSQGEEDCLHLNVFIPKKVYQEVIQAKREKLLVIVFIHGGGYATGSSDMGSPEYLMDEDVVLVSMNYRLDMFGFASTGDDVIRGNMGLKDQTLALKWVQRNIHIFGGDPNRVTLLGGSAGAASAHSHMLSPSSKGLFHKVFAMSGSAASAWAILPTELTVNKTIKMAEEVGCTAENRQELIQCLQKVEAKDLIRTHYYLKTDYAPLFPIKEGTSFYPTVETVKDDRAFFTEYALKTIKSGKFTKVPLMIGHTTHEGLMSTSTFWWDSANIDKFKEVEKERTKWLFGISNNSAVWENDVDRIRNFYFPPKLNGELTTEDNINNYVQLFGDGNFVFPIWKTVLHQRKFSSVYYYLYNMSILPDPLALIYDLHPSWPILMSVAYFYIKSLIIEKILGMPPTFRGNNHNINIFHYFPAPFYSISKEDRTGLYEDSKDLIKLLVDFARNDTTMEFRGVKLSENPKEGELVVLSFNDNGVNVSPPGFIQKMKALIDLVNFTMFND